MPLYGGPTGAQPKYQPGLSAAAGPPKALNGGKEYKITLKSGLKWSNGTPITGNDVVFDIDLLKAAVKESAANWGQYTTGQFPVSVTSATAKGNTVTIKLNKAYNPGYFLNNQLQDTNYGVYPLPSKVWNVTSAGGKHVNNWSDPKVAKQIYDYLNKLGGQVAQFSNALWKTSDGPFTLGSYNTTNNSFVLKPNPKYGGSPKPKNEVDVNTYTSFTAELNAVKSGGLGVMLGFDPSQIPQMSSLKSDGILAYGGPSLGLVRRRAQLQEHHRPHGQGDRAAVRPSGASVPDQPAGRHQGYLQGRGRARLRPDPVGADARRTRRRARPSPTTRTARRRQSRC